jgi:hypothetical protein
VLNTEILGLVFNLLAACKTTLYCRWLDIIVELQVDFADILIILYPVRMQ